MTLQKPPMFSALKYQGKRLYTLARQGIRVDREMRQVQVHSLKLTDFDPPLFTIEVECSGGTYVRSLVADIAKELSTCATVEKLHRFKQGSFTELHALPHDCWNNPVALMDAIAANQNVLVE